MPERTEHERHTKHAPHEHRGEESEEKPEPRTVGEFVKPGEEVRHHPPVGGPGGEKTMPIGTPVRSITPESSGEEESPER